MGGLIKAIKDLKRSEGLILSPRYDEWLIRNPDPTYPQWVIDKVMAEFTDGANNRRTGRFGASSRGICPRRQLLQFKGVEQRRWLDTGLTAIFNDGKWRHARWQANLLTAGLVTDVEAKFYSKKYRTGVSLDGINEDEDWFLEVKGRSPFVGDDLEKYMLQVHTCFMISGVSKCVVIVENKGSNQYQEYVIEPELRYMVEVKEELDELNKHRKTKTLPQVLPQCQQRKGDEYKGCPVREACEEAAEGEGIVWL